MFCRDAQVDKVCVVVEKVLKDVRSRARERGDHYRGQRELMLVVKFIFLLAPGLWWLRSTSPYTGADRSCSRRTGARLSTALTPIAKRNASVC